MERHKLKARDSTASQQQLTDAVTRALDVNLRSGDNRQLIPARQNGATMELTNEETPMSPELLTAFAAVISACASLVWAIRRRAK